MQGLAGLIVLGMLGWLVVGWLRPPVYTASFYPESADLTRSWSQGDLKSLDECRQWVRSQALRDLDGDYDYECGKNCKHKDGLALMVCDTTER